MAELSTHRAEVVWDDDPDDLRAHTVRVAGQALAGSCAASLGGDASKADPEELLVASLSACHMLWFLDFARRERLRVSSYEDSPEGTMNGERFTQVLLRPRVTFRAAVDAETVQALHLRAHGACFIANSVNFPVDIQPS